MLSNETSAKMSHDKTNTISYLVGRLYGDMTACNNDKMSNDTWPKVRQNELQHDQHLNHENVITKKFMIIMTKILCKKYASFIVIGNWNKGAKVKWNTIKTFKCNAQNLPFPQNAWCGKETNE